MVYGKPWLTVLQLKLTLTFQKKELFLYIYVNHIIHCKIKRDNQQVPKIVRVPGNKTNPTKKKNLQIMQVTTAVNTEDTDS